MIGCYFPNDGAPESLEGLPTTRAALLRREVDSRGGHTPSPPPGENGVAVLPQKRRQIKIPKNLTPTFDKERKGKTGEWSPGGDR